ncbi:MAG: LytTR family DNA-binding domain-containing protein [Syntrophomonas sp.]|nr:LytTR family DNA-binding domain-containing protein [Bacilli bacterium]
MLKVLLLEDDDYTREFLNKLLSEISGITEIFATSSGEEAISWAEINQPQLLLFDIELGGNSSNGLFVANAIYTFNKDAYIIFLTGYSQYALDSFAVHPYSYMLKPINIAKFKDLIAEIVDKVQAQSKINSDILALKNRYETMHINKNDILFIEARRHRAVIHTLGNHLELNKSLDELETMLGSGFLRVHRSYIVNLKKIKKTKEIVDRSYEIEFCDCPKTAFMSRTYYSHYKEYFEL